MSAVSAVRKSAIMLNSPINLHFLVGKPTAGQGNNCDSQTGDVIMGRPRKQIETPGAATAGDETASAVTLLNSTPANTQEQLHAATAGATVLTVAGAATAEGTGVGTEGGSPAALTPVTLTPEALAARNEALSGLSAEAFKIITKFEAYGFIDEHENPLTNCLDFIELVKLATTSQTTTAAIVTEDGQLKTFSAPVLTDRGWLVK
jgi:hypothetical protein